MKTVVHYMGKVAAYKQCGIPAQMIKVALMQEGIPDIYADELCKIALPAGTFLGNTLRHIGAGIRGVANSFGGKAVPAAAEAMTGAATNAVKKPGLATRIGQSFTNAGRGYNKAVSTGDTGNFLLGGAKNFGGGMLGGGQGLAAGMGKATTGGLALSGAYGMLRPGQKGQQQQQPPMQQQMGYR